MCTEGEKIYMYAHKHIDDKSNAWELNDDISQVSNEFNDIE